MEGSSTIQIHADTNLDELIRRVPEVVPVFVKHRMHCVGCPIARFETVDDACRIYGKPLEPFLSALWSAVRQGQGVWAENEEHS